MFHIKASCFYPQVFTSDSFEQLFVVNRSEQLSKRWEVENRLLAFWRDLQGSKHLLLHAHDVTAAMLVELLIANEKVSFVKKGMAVARQTKKL